MGCGASSPSGGARQLRTPEEELADLALVPEVAEALRELYSEFRALDRDKDGVLSQRDAEEGKVPMPVFAAIIRSASLTYTPPPTTGHLLHRPSSASGGQGHGGGADGGGPGAGEAGAKKGKTKKKKGGKGDDDASSSVHPAVEGGIRFSEYALLKLSPRFPAVKETQRRLRASKWFEEFDSLEGDGKLSYQEARLAIKASGLAISDTELQERFDAVLKAEDDARRANRSLFGPKPSKTKWDEGESAALAGLGLNREQFTRLILAALDEADLKAAEAVAAATGKKSKSNLPRAASEEKEEDKENEEGKGGDEDDDEKEDDDDEEEEEEEER